MTKICFITTSLSSGGIEMYLLRFLRFLKRDSYDITVVVRSSEEGELAEDYQSLDITIVRQPLGYLHPVRIWRYYRLFLLKKYDVICDFNANFAGLPMLIARLVGIKKRIAFYRQGKDHFSPTFFRKLYNTLMNRLVYKYATQILSNSHSALTHFFPNRTFTDNRFKVIYNGVDLNEFEIDASKAETRNALDLPEDKFIVGHVGRLDPAKNHQTILKSFKLLAKKYSDAHLVLCGRNTEKLMERVKNLGLSDRVTILGYRSDVPRVLKSFDCFVFPSITEGQPNALIEAMISGLPVVASNIDPIKECMPGKYYQWLVDPTDSAALAAKLIELRTSKYDTEALKVFAIDHFDAKQNFELFRTELING